MKTFGIIQTGNDFTGTMGTGDGCKGIITTGSDYFGTIQTGDGFGIITTGEGYA